jgi:hypothetical protein
MYLSLTELLMLASPVITLALILVLTLMGG